MTADAINSTSQADILTAIVEHLRGWFGLKAADCYETLYADAPKLPRAGDLTITVSMADGVFDVDAQHGGGRNQVFEAIDIEVSAFTRIKVDKQNPDTAMLLDARRGLLQRKREILSAMIDAHITVDSGSVLIESIVAKYSTRPGFDGTTGMITITFALAYTWQLIDREPG